MFSGSIVALVTPFRNDNVDVVALERLIEMQIEAGTDAILVCGSTGEGLLLTNEERELIINISKEVVKKRVPIIVGASTPSTKEAIFFAKQADTLNVDGILSIAPYYVKPTQSGIIQHFTDIHNNSRIPIILYNNPSRCAVGIAVDTVISLANNTRIVALKDSDTYLGRVSVIKEKAPNLKLLSGDDMSCAGYLACGGDGTISVTANIAPRMVKEMIKMWQTGNIISMQKLNTKLTQLSEALFVESNPIPVKYALYMKGIIENELRKPLCKASDATKNAIESVMSKWSFS